MSNRPGSTLKPDDRVKFSGWAFDSGVASRNKATLAYRGIIIRLGRPDPEMLVVRWDHRKTTDRLHRSFLMRATTAARR